MLRYNHECYNFNHCSDWSICNAFQTIQMPRYTDGYTDGSGSLTSRGKEKEWTSIRLISAITMMDDDVKTVRCSLKYDCSVQQHRTDKENIAININDNSSPVKYGINIYYFDRCYFWKRCMVMKQTLHRSQASLGVAYLSTKPGICNGDAGKTAGNLASSTGSV